MGVTRTIVAPVLREGGIGGECGVEGMVDAGDPLGTPVKCEVGFVRP